ncbi:4-oxalocrotonate tautomerase [Priestia endophytica]|uniref:4-oxalocrotonate tautomerase n=1 Tax=Priestia endophytica TaxID=135735 RepID=UPI000DCA673D|nr:4-oxalocrotonate tautomerase [Priestia endophytica]RAS83652.1 4-oxalocrotonate tautomerase [Priestia endophytica]
MPIVNIQIMQGRSIDKVKSVVARVTDVISEELNSPKENIRVLVTEVPNTHWGIAGVTVADRDNK